MKISVDKIPSGISIKCFIPKSEVDSLMSSSGDAKKDFRKQKTYKVNLSKQKIAVLQAILDDLFSNISMYTTINKSSTNVSFDLVRSKIFQNLEPSFDEYQKKSFDDVYEIARSFTFDIEHTDEIYTIKNNYNLDYDSDILVSIIGAFRYGKTTLIKKLFGFGDDYVFPLVDKGRTSLNNCYFRAIIVQNGHINLNTNSEIKKVPIADYRFKNEITLHSFEDFYNLTLSSNMNNAFEQYCILRKNKEVDAKVLHTKVLEKFITHDKANLDEVFGDINIATEETNEFYEELFRRFDEKYSKIYNDLQDYDENNNLQIPNEYKDFLDKDLVFYDFVQKHLESKTQKIIDEISAKTNKNIIIKDNKIKFELTKDEIGDIDVYYNNFASNNSKYRGQLLRLLVSEIYTEIDLDIDVVYPQENCDDNLFDQLTSIVFTDTMGAGHKSNKHNIENGSSNDIINNLPLLNESDIIVLLDDASQSMKDVTLSQIKSLVSFGLKDKLLLTYSWYDNFLKNDMKNDEERVRILCNILEEKLNESFSKNLYTSQKVYSTLMDNNTERILFLKGLVQYVPKSSSTSKSARRNRKVSSIDEINDEELAKKLNNGVDFGEDKCFKLLIEKIISISSKIKELSNTSFTLETNIIKADVAYNFFEMYNDFYKEFVDSQHKEYITWTPSYKTTEALCNQLKNGKTGFTGISRSLYPFNDALAILIKHFNFFLDNSFEVIIAEDEDGNRKDKALNEDFILNKIRKDFTDKVGEFFRLLIIDSNRKDWDDYYSDWGYGVQDRRAHKIFTLLIKTLKINQENKNLNISVSLLNHFQKVVNDIVAQYNNR